MNVLAKARKAHEDACRGGSLEELQEQAVWRWKRITGEAPENMYLRGEKIFIEERDGEQTVVFEYDPGLAIDGYFRIADYRGQSLDMILESLEDIGAALAALDHSIQSGLSMNVNRLGSDGNGEDTTS